MMSVITDGTDGNDKHDKYNHDDDVEDLCGCHKNMYCNRIEIRHKKRQDMFFQKIPQLNLTS